MVADQVLTDPSGSGSQRPVPPLVCHPEISHAAFKIGLSLDEHTRLGPLVTVPRIVNRASEKHELALKTGAIGLDMESAAVGQVARSKKIPFVVVRGISDLIDENLPSEFNLFLRPFGWVQGLPAVLLSPKCWPHLVRLQAQMVKTSQQMTQFFQLFFHQGDLWDPLHEHNPVLG